MPRSIFEKSRLPMSAATALTLLLISAAVAAERSEAYMVPLFPQKERDLKNGLPPGMTAASFWAAHGSAKLTKQDDGKVKIEFALGGLTPNGVYTLWNVLETEP